MWRNVRCLRTAAGVGGDVVRCPNCGMKECCGAYMSEEIAETTARAERLQAELVKAEGERDELREAIENAPCHDFCREAKSKHHIPYDQHHHACWKVAALQLEGQDYMRAALGGLNG